MRFQNEINKKLQEAEGIGSSIENLIAGFLEIQQKGGICKLVLYPKNGTISMCESILTEETIETFIEILLTDYNNKLESVRKEINKYINGMKKNR